LIVDIKKRLGDFSLDVALEMDGGVSALLGASGSGKSMTLMCIAGIVKPDCGRIVLNGRTLFDSARRINLAPQQRRVGYLFQNYALFPHMTVRQNILSGLYSSADKSEKRNKLCEIIESMQLQGLEKHLPIQLSGGQQQRVALARILVGNPDMLVLDEPFSALDSHLREQLQVETKKMLERFGKDALLVTHSRDEAYHMCSKTALLNSGRLVIYKGTKELFADPESRHACLLTGCKNIIGAEKSGECSVYVADWDVTFATSQPVGDSLCAIGIRAHSFSPQNANNCFPIHIKEEMEGPFEYNIQFRYKNQNENSRNIWWLVPKANRPAEYPLTMGIDASDIMLLYK
jgi:molybdate transport system ATP-binding protein